MESNALADFGTEMASAIGEDRGWGMSEAVPQPAKRPPQYTQSVYKAWLCQQLGSGVGGSYVNV